MSGSVLIDGLKRFSSWQAQAKKLPRYVQALEAQLANAQASLASRDEYIQAVEFERAKIVGLLRARGEGLAIVSGLALAIERGDHLR